jgi:hypothetical protein
LTQEDLNFIEILKKIGMIDESMSEDNITPELLESVRKLFKEEYGIEDLNSINNPDSRFSNPENTWELYKNALIEGNIELALKCMMPRSAKRQREIYQTLGNEVLKQEAIEMRTIERIVGDDKSAKYRIRRNIKGKDITFYIYFINLFGEWKIEKF